MILVTFLFCSTLAHLPVPQQADRDLVRAIRDAWTANVASFPFGTLEFDLIQGNADSLLAARDGKFTAACVAKGAYIYNGRNAYYRKIFRAEDLKSHSTSSGNQHVSTLASVRLLTNSGYTLQHMIDFAADSYQLIPGGGDFDRRFGFLLPLGRLDAEGVENIGKLIRDSDDGKSNCGAREAGADATIDGRPVVNLKFACKAGTIEYWCDLERGGCPLQIIEMVDDRKTIHSLDSFKSIPGRGWLPFRRTKWESGTGKAEQINLTSVEFMVAPKPDAFDMVFDKPVVLYDDAKGLRLPAKRVWNLSSLPSASSPGVQKVELPSITQDEVPAMPGERTSRFKYYWYAGAGIVLSLTAIVGLVRRMRKS